MAMQSLYCPECGYALTAPLARFAPPRCKWCNKTVRPEHANVKKSQSVISSIMQPPKLQYVGVAEDYTGSQVTTFSRTIGVAFPGSVVVVAAAYVETAISPTTVTIGGVTATSVSSKLHGTTKVQVWYANIGNQADVTVSMSWTPGAGPSAIVAHAFAISNTDTPLAVDHKDGQDNIVNPTDPFTTATINGVSNGSVAIGIVGSYYDPGANYLYFPNTVTAPFTTVYKAHIGQNGTGIAHAVAIIESTTNSAVQFSGAYGSENPADPGDETCEAASIVAVFK